MTVSGVLNIDKPGGCTSHDVVADVRKLSGQRKVGHTGTLDPMATGVLLVCLGQATRLIEYSMPGRKAYRAIIHFGVSTDTLDAKGNIIDRRDPSGLTLETLRGILPRFKGELEQLPPIFSAIKQDGQPLYKKARAGKAVEVAPRSVMIHALDLIAWNPPELTLDVVCSAGTYVRALARDLGEAAGTGAHLSGLVRTANGPWTVAQAVSLDQLKEAAAEDEQSGWQAYLQPPDRLVAHLPKVILSAAQAADVGHGRQLVISNQEIEPPPQQNPPPEYLRVYTPADDFLAILKLIDQHENLWQPKKVFHL